MQEQLKEVILDFIGYNYGSQEMEDPCYNIDELASYICQHMTFGNDVGFERVRRITGYLVGTTDRWNNAKKAELNDRVKHTEKGGE